MMYCATCDAPLFKGMKVAVIGGGNSGFEAAVQLQQIAEHVTILEIQDSVNADEILQDKIQKADNTEIMTNATIKEFKGEKMLKSIIVENTETGETSERDAGGVFVEIGSVPNVDFLNGMLEMNEIQEIKVACDCTTNVDGLFAAGDCTTVPEKQIIVAAGQGAIAALGAYRYLIRKQ